MVSPATNWFITIEHLHILTLGTVAHGYIAVSPGETVRFSEAFTPLHGTSVCRREKEVTSFYHGDLVVSGISFTFASWSY